MKFYTYWTEKVEDTGDYLTLQDIVIKFQARMQQNTEAEAATCSNFPLSFHGEAVVGVKEKEEKVDCVNSKGKDKSRKHFVCCSKHL
jgi:hypothetical protein